MDLDELTPPAGVVRVADASRRFDGWLELLAILAEILSPAAGAEGTPFAAPLDHR